MDVSDFAVFREVDGFIHSCRVTRLLEISPAALKFVLIIYTPEERIDCLDETTIILLQFNPNTTTDDDPYVLLTRKPRVLTETQLAQ